ncbi:MAG: laccase domain-containing protein [Candidatus Saccharimonadales bacterium]
MRSNVKIAVSNVQHGTMKRSTAIDPLVVDENRQAFLAEIEVVPADAVLVQVDYDTDDFCRYQTVSKSAQGEGIVRVGRVTDALATQEKGVALFLPLADCAGVVLHDVKQDILLLSHLGRHSVEQYGAQKSVDYLVRTHGSRPQDIDAWISPAAGAENYPLRAFEQKGLQAVICAQLASAGITPTRIEIDECDTTKDKSLFSHSEFKKGNRAEDGRFAVVAVLR